MKLSKNFTLAEFVRSDTAKSRGIKNLPTDKEIKNMKILCENLLQPFREYLGIPVSISSGFRNKELNKAVGGVDTSQHVLGEAADCKSSIGSREMLKSLISSGLKFDQAILYPTFLHLSYREGRSRRQVLYAKGVSEL